MRKFCFIFAIIAVVLYFYYHKGTPRQIGAKSGELPEITLNVMPARAEKVTVDNSYIGYVTPINSVAVKPYINGFLEDVMVTGGQLAEQGDTLVVIRQDEYKGQPQNGRGQTPAGSGRLRQCRRLL